jgi:hypothetical protein
VPGIAQVWLTHDELEAVASLFDNALGNALEETVPRPLLAARDKIEKALAPVACEVASGPKTP